jgi:beta-glucosidase
MNDIDSVLEKKEKVMGKGNEKTFEERAAYLVGQMTLEEKISHLGVAPPAIPRLGIPEYSFTNEAAHGLFLINYVNSKEYDVTAFPVCLAMSQSWDVDKLRAVGDAISDEARAYRNVRGDFCNFFTPTVNLGRDPRNGRSDEAFGEDPLLAGRLASAYIQGFQGMDKTYLKTVMTPKHFALNSSENNRHTGSSNADEATIREYYAKVFEYTVKEGKAESIMTSYNRINGIPASANHFLLEKLLREEWGFDGFVVSDCGAVADTFINPYMSAHKIGHAHYYAQDELEASAMTLIAGTDNSCGSEYSKFLYKALKKGLITEDIIDCAAIRNLTSRFRLGEFYDQEKNPYSAIGMDHVCSEYNQNLCVDMANDTIVLLKNDKNLLPLNKDELKTILVVGPNAKFRQLGGYSAGTINRMIDTPVNIMALDGIRNAVKDMDVAVHYEKGWCVNSEYVDTGVEASLPGVDIGSLFKDMIGIDASSDEIIKMRTAQSRWNIEDPDFRADNDVLFARALDAAKTADVVIMVAGTDESSSSEEHDREDLTLPYDQNEKIKQMLAVNPNTVVVLTTPGMVEGDSLDEAHSLLYACFAGEAQGTAIANVLFGDVNPNAKLTATWYESVDDLPYLNEYGIKKQDTCEGKARTYWYFDQKVRFPFGYGLSYTTFEYSNLQVEKPDIPLNKALTVSIDVKNTGNCFGKEIVEVYLKKLFDTTMGHNKPIRQLKGFKKVALNPGESKTVKIEIPISDMTFWSNFYHKMIVPEGRYLVEVGGSSDNLPHCQEFTIEGIWQAKLFNVYADLSKYIYNINEKGQVSLAATLEDARHLKPEEYVVTYKVKNPEIAVVDENGVITAKKTGTTEIICKVSYEGVTKESRRPIAVK